MVIEKEIKSIRELLRFYQKEFEAKQEILFKRLEMLEEISHKEKQTENDTLELNTKITISKYNLRKLKNN